MGKGNEEGLIPNFNLDLGFVLRLNSILDTITYARTNKLGETWADFILACYMEIKAELDDAEVEKCEDLKEPMMKEVARLRTMRKNQKNFILTEKLFDSCWDFEDYLRKLIMEHDLMNTKKVEHPEDEA